MQFAYTHYWNFIPFEDKEEQRKRFKSAAEKIKLCIDTLAQYTLGGETPKLGNSVGEGEPIITDERIEFNGKGVDKCGGFIMKVDDAGSYFCCTEQRSYDVCVCIALLCFKHEFDDHFRFSSDGFIGNLTDTSCGAPNWKTAKSIVMSVNQLDVYKNFPPKPKPMPKERRKIRIDIECSDENREDFIEQLYDFLCNEDNLYVGSTLENDKGTAIIIKY